MSFGNFVRGPVMVDEAPTIEIRDRLFYVTFEDIDLALVGRPATFYKTFQLMAAAIQQHCADDGEDAEVINFPRAAH